ncbi:MAG: muramidase [Flavipsychrobacter sp.]|nr:muramidase [Flavipsychrobacter sp.]
MKNFIKINLLMLSLLVVMTSARAQNATYISNHRIIAAVLSQRYGIPAPVILAVAAIESSGGKAPVAKVLNNHFGMCGKNNIVNHKGHKSRYKQYANEIESYIDFCGVISRKHFYSRLKDSDNCRAWIKAMSHAGYSEVPEEWEQKVLGVLSRIEHSTDLALGF